MTVILLLGIGLQAVLFHISRAASALAAFFVSAFFLLVSAGKMFAGLPVVIFGLDIPAFIAVIAAALWLAVASYLVFRETRADLIPIMRQVCLGFVRGFVLCMIVVAAIAIIVFPSVFIAIEFPLVFSLIVVAGLLAILVLYLIRKYRGMAVCDASDTRQDARDTRPSLVKRYLFRVLLRPLLIVLLALAYAYMCALLLYTPLWGGLGFVLLTICIMLAARFLRRTPYVAAGE
jgi:hypothetical protein